MITQNIYGQSLSLVGAENYICSLKEVIIYSWIASE